jgi:ectoine hydroxylase-related dioxygenase (phytanoyl-CoA dioxygenase family)
MQTAFKNSIIHTEFISNGLVTFPLLDEKEVDFVLSVYESINRLHKRLEQPQFYGVNYSLGTLTQEENDALMAPVIQLLQSKLVGIFEHYELLGCVFITKPPRTSTYFDYHQDWSYTNESAFAFPTCWVPLQDTHPGNGGMSIIKGSHRFFSTFRSDSLPSSRVPFEEIPQELRTDIHLKKGECLAFHQASFHGSYPNHSEYSRPVIAFVVKPKEAPIIHYIANGKQVRGYQMDTTQFNSMLTQIPKSQLPKEAKLFSIIDDGIEPFDSSCIISRWRLEQTNHKLFKNADIHRSFINNGYVVLKNVFSVDTIRQLRSYYTDHFCPPIGMSVTHHSETDCGKNSAVSNVVFELIRDKLDFLFEDYQELISHFAAKTGDGSGLLNFHQDWSIIEEELFAVAHCWIPLQEVDEKNGALAVLPGSHQVFSNYRSGSCPIRFLPIADFSEQVKYMKVNECDMVVYHPALFHGSGANHSSKVRVAIIAAIANRNAKMVYYNQENEDVIMYELQKEELFGRLDYLSQKGKPLGAKIKKVPRRVLDMSDLEIQKKLSK